MSVPSQLEMSVSAVVWRAVGGDVGGGAEHERWGAAASRGVAGCRSRWAAGWCGGAATGAQRAPSVAAGEGGSGCGRLGADLEEARSAKQSQDGYGDPLGGFVDRASELRRFRPDAGGREARRRA